MENQKHARFLTLATQNSWEELLAEIELSEEIEATLDLSLWKVKVLRALSRGKEANECLLKACKSQRKEKVEKLIELSEELLQCAYYKEVEYLINLIKNIKHPGIIFLKSAIARDKLRWEEAWELADELKEFGEIWSKYADFSQIYIKIKRAHLNEAEKLLKPYWNEQSQNVQKLIARFEIASGKYTEAKLRLCKISEKSPLDWEWPILLAATKASLGEDVNSCINLINKGLQRQPRQAEGFALLLALNLSVNNTESAQQAMVESLSIKPWLDAAIVPYVQFLENNQNKEEASKLIEKAIELFDTPKRQSVKLDLLRMNGGKKNEIINKVNILLAKHPEDLDVLKSSSAALIACSKKDKATYVLERILSFNKYDYAAKNNLAILYKEFGDIDQSIQHFKELAKNNDQISRINYAKVLIDNGGITEAENILSELLKNNNRTTPILRSLAEIKYKTNKVNEAHDIVKRLCEIESRNAENWVLLSSISIKLFGFQDGLNVLNKARNLVDNKIIIDKKIYDIFKQTNDNNNLIEVTKLWLEANVNNIDYLLLRANALLKAEKWAEAEVIYRDALMNDTEQGSIALARFYMGRASFVKARKVAEQWIRNDKDNIKAWALLAEVCYVEEKPEEALKAVDEAIRIDPYRFSLIRQKVGILLTSGKKDEAINLARDHWRVKRELHSLTLLVDILNRNLKFQEALDEIELELSNRSNEIAFQMFHAKQLLKLNLIEANIDTLLKLNRLHPENEEIVKELVKIYSYTKQYKKSTDFIRKLCVAKPDRLDLHLAISEISLQQGFVDEARDLLINILDKNPFEIDAYLLLCKVEQRTDNIELEKKLWLSIAEKFAPHRWILSSTKRWVDLNLIEEIQNILNSWRIKEPQNLLPWWCAFEVAKYSKRYKQALVLLEQIEKRQGVNSETIYAKAILLDELEQSTSAIQLMKIAVENQPGNSRFRMQLLNLKLKIGDWDSFDEDLKKVEFILGDAKYHEFSNLFFNLNCHPYWSSGEIYEYYKLWYEYTVKNNLNATKKYRNSLIKNKKLKIGYCSPDFRQHAVAKFSDPMLRFHDRNNFELYGYAHIGHKMHDNWTEQFKSYFDHWREVRQLTIDEIEQQIIEDEIDILIDLAGHTSNNMLNVFARRPAPIMASHVMGAGQTTGLPQIDYLITGSLWPREFDAFSAEKIARFPFTGIPIKIPDDAPLPSPWPCLSRGFITFGVFARPVRVSRKVVKIWADILKKLPNSRLRFEHKPYSEPDVILHYQDLFKEYGVEAARLEFLNTRPYWDAISNIDIVLDTFPAGSGTTATDSLFMDRLVITLRDRPAMGQVPSEQLAAMNLVDHCVAHNSTDYINKAVNLASNLNLIVSLSHGLRHKFLSSPLVDYIGYSQALSLMYRQWWVDFCDEPNLL